MEGEASGLNSTVQMYIQHIIQQTMRMLLKLVLLQNYSPGTASHFLVCSLFTAAGDVFVLYE